MLPLFPNFKKLELSDQADIEAITSLYQPYSDFNFISMWCWNTNNSIQLSQLNGNLIAILNDHFTNELHCSFLGYQDVNNTVTQLNEFATQHNMAQPAIRLIPEISLLNLDFNKFFIEIDLNSCDYIYDIQQLCTYSGVKYSNKRKILNSFLRKHATVSAKILDLKSNENKKHVIKLNSIWANKKIEHDNRVSFDKELQAIDRFLKIDDEKTLCVGIFIDDELVGYSIFTLLSKNYAICHFSKANITSIGIYEYLMHESANILFKQGYKFLNYEEDLGLPGLRQAKNSFRPVGFLRKYFVKQL